MISSTKQQYVRGKVRNTLCERKIGEKKAKCERLEKCELITGVDGEKIYDDELRNNNNVRL